MSQHTLTPAEISLLNHGLNFAPSNKPDPFVLFKDLNRYVRILTLQRFYQLKNAKNASNTDISDPVVIPESSSQEYEFDYDVEMIEMLEHLYHDDSYAGLDLFTQHLHTSPPVIPSGLKQKSIFYPYQSKGPYLTTFYNTDLKNMCAAQHQMLLILVALLPK